MTWLKSATDLSGNERRHELNTASMPEEVKSGELKSRIHLQTDSPPPFFFFPQDGYLYIDSYH